MQSLGCPWASQKTGISRLLLGTAYSQRIGRPEISRPSRGQRLNLLSLGCPWAPPKCKIAGLLLDTSATLSCESTISRPALRP